jgi:hypothetical protein
VQRFGTEKFNLKKLTDTEVKRTVSIKISYSFAALENLDENVDINGAWAMRIRWAENVAHMGEMNNIYKILVKKPEGKKPLGRTSHRWEDNPAIDFRCLKVCI